MLKPDGYVFIKTLLIYGSKRRASSPYKRKREIVVLRRQPHKRKNN